MLRPLPAFALAGVLLFAPAVSLPAMAAAAPFCQAGETLC